MATINGYILVGRQREHVIGRTPDELRILAVTLRDSPDEWFVYSVHLNMASAHNRASRLRGPEFPKSLMEFQGHLEYKAHRHAVHGPCVLVRWVH